MWKWICIGTTTVVVYLIKRHMRGVYCKSKSSLQGKTVIITGASSGIGKATAEELAFRHAKVILACRDILKANRVAEDIKRKTKNPNVIAKMLNLNSFQSVVDFADDIIKTEERLDILINNAGVYGLDFQLTKDFLESHMATNYFGHFLLTNLLIEKLRSSIPSRVLVVSSGLSKFGKINLNNLGPFIPDQVDTNSTINSGKKDDKLILKTYDGVYDAKQAYKDSKLANNLFAKELHSRLQFSGINVYCIRPGMVRSDLGRHIKSFMKVFLYPLAYILLKSPRDGCQTVLHCCLNEEKASGQFYADCKVEAWNKPSSDMQMASKLWTESEKIVSLHMHLSKLKI